MKYRLFDEIERKDTGPEPESEAEYEYINRSARPDAQKIRSLLEDWFSRYPEKQNDFLFSNKVALYHFIIIAILIFIIVLIFSYQRDKFRKKKMTEKN